MDEVCGPVYRVDDPDAAFAVGLQAVFFSQEAVFGELLFDGPDDFPLCLSVRLCHEVCA